MGICFLTVEIKKKKNLQLGSCVMVNEVLASARGVRSDLIWSADLLNIELLDLLIYCFSLHIFKSATITSDDQITKRKMLRHGLMEDHTREDVRECMYSILYALTPKSRKNALLPACYSWLIIISYRCSSYYFLDFSYPLQSAIIYQSNQIILVKETQKHHIDRQTRP